MAALTNPPIVYLINKKQALEYYSNKKARICKCLNLKERQLDQLPLVTIRGERYFDEHVSLRLHYLSGYKIPIRAFEFRRHFLIPIKAMHGRDNAEANMSEDYMAGYPDEVRNAVVTVEDPSIAMILEALDNAMASSRVSYNEKLESIGIDLICELIVRRQLVQFCSKTGIPITIVRKWLRSSPGNREAFEDAVYMSGLVLSDQAVDIATKWLPDKSEMIKNKKIMTDTLSREAANKMRQKKEPQVAVLAPQYNYITVKEED